MRCKLLVLAVVSAWPVPALADDRSDCLADKGSEIGIRACSNLIARDHNDAVAYHHRGIAVQATGDLDRALADYTKAIELKPTYGPAYESRARAYTVKGDYERAVADVTMFVELTAKPAGGAQVTTSSKRAAKQPGKLAPRAKPDVPAEEPPLDDWPEWAPKP
jgi:tetratricopeptide (TPR) repeat protein